MPYFINRKNEQIAYKRIKGKKPGIIFIHGLQSDMYGEKALKIEKYAKRIGHSFIKFDCRGHGKSYGKFENYCISDWKEDTLNIIDNLTKGPQIILGSSMGGWLMMLAARYRPKRIKGLIGIAAAPDFTKYLFKSLAKKHQKQIINNGKAEIKAKEYSIKYIITKKLIQDGKKNFIIRKNFRFNKPTILIHGNDDDVVSTDIPFKIMKKITGKNIQIKILKESGHRLSSKNDINIILASISEIININ